MEKIELLKGDITKIPVDGIVNAANSELKGGGGVDGAIHLAGGPAIMEECNKIRDTKGGCPTGEAVYTTAGNLPAKYIIHTVGPVWRGGQQGEAELLANAYRSSLKLASELGLKTISFPNISTGVYGYPKREAAEIAFNVVQEFFEKNDKLKKVIFVCYDIENFQLYQALL